MEKNNNTVSNSEHISRFVVYGMQRDISISKAQPEFTYENMNIRITSRENNTLMSATNEKGNKYIQLVDKTGTNTSVDGTIIGYCVLNEYLVLFTHNTSTGYDYIYKIHYTNNLFVVEFYFKDLHLGFDINHPIETLGQYENEKIQKVYWTDGINQPRVINIADVDNKTFTNASFDFVPSLKLFETISIEKNITSNGMFSSGVVQYCFTYFNKYNQESNIFYVSPLYYTSFFDRGGSGEEKQSNSFTININNYDTSFDYIRIYSIHRTSLDAVPTVKKVVNIATNNGENLIYTDNNTSGELIDPTTLLYIGGESCTFKTMTSKDNTLFFGNIKLNRNVINDTVINGVKNGVISFDYKSDLKYENTTDFYTYLNQLNKNSHSIKTFKYLETYRFGLQFQHITGKWSEPIWVNDARNTLKIDYSDTLHVKYPEANFTLSSNVINSLVSQDYVRVRPVIVYPTEAERECVCQGIVCPTVFNAEDRLTNSPFSQSSWFARPNYMDALGTSDTPDGFAEFRHLRHLPFTLSKNCEIQCMHRPSTNDLYTFKYPILGSNNYDATPNDYSSNFSEMFFVDQSIFTMHSPEFEFNDAIKTMDTSNLKFRIVGVSPVNSGANNISIETSTACQLYKPNNGVPQGFCNIKQNESPLYPKRIIAGYYWFDEIVSSYSGVGGDYKNQDEHPWAFAVYPWHRNGSMNNQRYKIGDDTVLTSMLSKKKISNELYSCASIYLDYANIWNSYVADSTIKTGISGVKIFNSAEKTLIKIPAQKNSVYDKEITYYGNVDKIVKYNESTVNTSSTNVNKWLGYPMVAFTNWSSTRVSKQVLFNYNFYQLFGSTTELTDASKAAPVYGNPVPTGFDGGTWWESMLNKEITKDLASYDPVSIKYKSGPHAVLSLNFASDVARHQRILPVGTIQATGDNLNSVEVGTLYWDGAESATSLNRTTISQDVINIPYSNEVHDTYKPYFWIGELYNDNIVNRFGGQTEEAFENNTWLPCGEPQLIVSSYNGNLPHNYVAKSSVVVKWTDGDTFFQRYDCLNTYPYTMDDQNSITDIVSFMCETRINIDGRYDKNKGQTDNTLMTPSIFNLMNSVYSQQDNFFSYHGLNHNKFIINEFPNSITWTTEKSLGELVDSWTNITMASTLDLDGDKGKIQSLNTFNNEIYCFQNSGFSNILFNSRIQIPTSDGVPIEISNGQKVTGKRYISSVIGCLNKWSVLESSGGLYFIDNLGNTLYKFAETLTPISDMLGFRTWLNNNSYTMPWNPSDFSNFRTFYDKANGDIYFSNKDYCLVYSELLNQFTSFMSYKSVSGIFNIGDKLIDIKDNSLWLQNEGDYNMFFNKYEPYYIVFRINPEPTLTKMFSTIDFRADSFDGNNLTDKTFDKLTVWNEYQFGESILTDVKGRLTSLKKKFRIWRASIPRDKNKFMNRIRNPWIYLKLSTNYENILKTEFHDLIIHYFI